MQDTRGWLSTSERRELLRPLAAAHVRNVVGRTRLALHLHPGRHAHVAPERLEPPRTVLARRAEETAARRLPPVLLHHSRRTFRFGLALGVVTGTEVDEELTSDAITKEFYIEKDRTTPDVTHILQSFADKDAATASND